MLMLDCIVIGAGLSGLSAALVAAQAGLSVRVVATGHGTTHWSAGTLDVLGYLPPQDERIERPLQRLADLPAGHPYARLGGAEIHAALQTLVALLAAQGLEYRGASET